MSAQSPSALTASRCSASRCLLTRSALVAVATTGDAELPRPSSASWFAMYRSPGPTFWSAGRQNTTTSTSVRVSRTRSLRRCPSKVRGRCRPGVSTRTSCASGRCTIPRITCRVVCGRPEVIATLLPTSALVRVDFPAFGRPMIDANPDRNSVTTMAFLLTTGRYASLGRGPIYRPMPWLRRLLLAPGALHQQGRDPVPTAFHPLGEESNAVNRRCCAGDRHLPARLCEQPCRGVHLVVVDLQAEQLAQLVERQSGRDAEDAVAEVFDVGPTAVVLVGELTDDLLQGVLDRDEPGDTAILVHHDAHVGRPFLHVPQQVVDRLRLRHVHRWSHHRLDRVLLVLFGGPDAADDVLEVHDAEHVVDGVADDRNARIAGC